MKLSELTPLRKRIDRLDTHILSLLNDRLRLVRQIGQLKGRYDLPYYDPTREKKIFERLNRRNSGPLSADALRRIFGELFSASRNLERPLRVAFLGPRWTFTEQAARQHFGSAPAYAPVSAIADIFSEVERGDADYGVVPIENSTEGLVSHTFEALLRSPLYVVAEEFIRVRLALLSRAPRLKDIRDVYSHAHGLAQASSWLSRHLPGVRTHEVSSTSAAAKLVRRRKRAAAIASELAARAYELNVLAPSIESSSQNQTRFLILGKSLSPRSGTDKTSLAFVLKDKVGALNHILSHFARRRINLTRIESRPSRKFSRISRPAAPSAGVSDAGRNRHGRNGGAFGYIFFVDFLGHMTDPGVRQALARVRTECEELRIFGSFPRSQPAG
ncbi:prephenate dehydratase [bacterium]|nr:prephenate dehydratase [bacterium]